MWRQHLIEVETPGRGFTGLTARVQSLVTAGPPRIRTGLCHLFLQHTSASLCLTENADPRVRHDLERVAQRLVPDGDPVYTHDDEGPDDMPAHARTLLAGHDLTLPIGDGCLQLGTWQGIYVWEHRRRPHRRAILVTLHGECVVEKRV